LHTLDREFEVLNNVFEENLRRIRAVFFKGFYVAQPGEFVNSGILIETFAFCFADQTCGGYVFDVNLDALAGIKHKFNDPNLEAAIREELGIEGRDITTADALGVTKLDLSGRDITDISALSNFKELTELDLGYKQEDKG
jgi:hypothetical protein